MSDPKLTKTSAWSVWAAWLKRWRDCKLFEVCKRLTAPAHQPKGETVRCNSTSNMVAASFSKLNLKSGNDLPTLSQKNKKKNMEVHKPLWKGDVSLEKGGFLGTAQVLPGFAGS